MATQRDENPIVGYATGTTSVTMPSHQAGDKLLAFAFRDGSNIPASTPVGWNTDAAYGVNTCAYTLGFKTAASSSETSGTWTNATSLIVLVIRNWDYVQYDQEGDLYLSSDPGIGLNSVVRISEDFIKSSSRTNVKLIQFIGHRSVNTNLNNEFTARYTALSTFTYTPIVATIDATDTVVSYISSTIPGVFPTIGSIDLVSPSFTGTNLGWMGLCVPIYKI